MAGDCGTWEGRGMTDAQTNGHVAARAVGVSRTYGAGDTLVHALDNVSVEFPRGRLTAVMGPSGSGKSTLMHCLAGLDRVTSGEVWIGDTKLSDLSERQLTLLRREQGGFIFQAYNLLPTLTAAENIALPLAIAGKKPEQAWYDRVIDAVGLRPRLKHRPTELSGGEQQRVAGARALVSQPTVIFADEPTGNLFTQTTKGIDVAVRNKANVSGNGGQQRAPLPASLLGKIKGISGVQDAEGGVSGYAQFIGKDGKPVTTGGAPTLGLSLSTVPQL